MDDALQQALMSRMGVPQPHSVTPPKEHRFDNAQAIQQAYAQGWSPNPVLLRAMLGRVR